MMIEVRRLNHHFTIGRKGGERRIPVLRDVDLDVREGEIAAIVGRSGSGKSTLLHILSGYLRASSGVVRVTGRDVTGLSEGEWAVLRLAKFGFIFQNFQLIPSMTAYENVELPLALQGVPPARRRQRALELMARVGVDGCADHYPGELSGGQQQRTAVARALVLEPKLVLADEPTGSLDSENEEALLALIRELNVERGTTFLIITHDERVAEAAQRKLLLQDGQLLNGGLVTAATSARAREGLVTYETI